MDLEQILFHFLDKNDHKKGPILLGLSGGADSLALFYLLQKYQQKKTLHFGIAHVDHGWREASAEEAQQLEQLARTLNIPFHLKKLNPHELSGNLEEACRKERLAFFHHLCVEHSYQAVILGHHADDQSETVLKKVLEGSSLPYLSGMQSVSVYQGLNLWRPLLNCTKKHIRQWLEQHGYAPFEDQTNQDTRFLRGRFRSKIIPGLSKEFGKDVSSSLCRLSQEAEELKQFLDAKLHTHIQSMVKGPFGTFLDLEENCPQTDFEIRYLIRKACESEGVRISHHIIEEACQKVRSQAADCQLQTGEAFIYLDRKRLFVMKQPLNKFELEIPIRMGRYSIEGWTIEVSQGKEQQTDLTGWREAWMGHMQAEIPEGNYTLKMGNTSLSKWWTNAKIPAFMRWGIPVLWSEDAIIHEFLTKRRLSNMMSNSKNNWLISVIF